MKAVSYSKERPNAALLALLILLALVVGWLSTQVAQASTIYVLEDKPASSVSPVVIVNGDPFISYYDPVQKDLRVAICSNPGCATNTTYFRILDSLGDVGGSPSMVLADGNPVISYFGENGILKVLACTDSVCSLPVTPITLTSAPTPHGRPSIVVENHHTYIAYRSTDANLVLIACEDVPCSAYSVRTLDVSDANGVIADQVSLLMLNGTPHVSYAKFLYGVQHGNLMVAACVNQTCSLPPIITLVDSDGDVGYASSMISLNGHPFISYINGTSGELRVASCTDSLCSQPAIITPIGMSSTGSDQTSVADFGGIPAVAFTARVENDHQHLKLAVCTNSTCTSATITTLESALNTGNRPTLVNLNGYALVSYSSEAEQRLKVYYGGDFIPPATFTPSNPTPTPSTTWEATDDGTPGSGQPTFTPSPTKTSTVTPEPSVTIGPTLVTPTSVTNAVPVRNYFTNGQVPLSWNPVSWASAYEVQLSTNSNFTDAGDFEFFFHNPLPADRLSFTTLELRNGTYYWRVRAIRADGALGSWSAIQQFTVSAETPTPTRTPTNTPSSTYTPSPTHTWTPSRTATRTPTVTPTPSPTSPAGVPKRPTPTIFPAPTLPSGSCVDGCST